MGPLGDTKEGSHKAFDRNPKGALWGSSLN